MESLKIPKGRGSKPPGTVPFAIRYNADEGSLEDILKPCESFPSSQPQNSEDFNWKKEFLHVNFFNRKRSESIEATPAPNAGAASTLNSNDAHNVGTWKLIKGRVSQAMEDMKSSKQQQQTTPELNDDSETEDLVVQNLASDGVLPEQFADVSHTMGALSDESNKRMLKQLNSITVETESDSDLDFMNANNLQSRIEIKTLKSDRFPSKEKRSENNEALNVPRNSSIRSTFLHKRKKVVDTLKKDDKKEENSRKHLEVESGIEVLEDMILPTATGYVRENERIENESFQENYMNEKYTEQSIPVSSTDNVPVSYTNRQKQNKSCLEDHSLPSLITLHSHKNLSKGKMTFRNTIDSICKNRFLIQTVALCLVILVLPLPDFFRGIITCLFTISLISFICEFITKYIERKSCLNGPEKTKFLIPDYSSLPNCEIPSVEEHKPLKSYAGWMNEINNYDPANYHISMTRSVYVRLDGSRLRISNTMTRIPKRCMWNESLINKTNITFAPSKSFDLTGCRIEMCPRGLARKRHFSRKYPIQLIIKNTNALKSDNSAKKSEISPANIVEALAANHITGAITHQSSNESNEDRSESQSEVDFGTALMNSNLQKLQTNLGGEHSTKENVPCGDETRLLLFARCDREKEDWYRRFLAASLGEITERELKIPDITQLTEELTPEHRFAGNDQQQKRTESGKINCDILQKQDSLGTSDGKTNDENVLAGLIMTSCAARNPPEYIKFMSKHQKACSKYKISVIKSGTLSTDFAKRHKRQKKQEDELWKGIDQSLYLGPAENVVWANVLIGRVLFGCLNDATLLEKIQEFLQKKLNAIRLPSFMEDVVIAQVHLGDTPPLIHRISQPLLDERGVWIDADVTYEGLVHMTITTKLNLLRFKRQQQNQSSGIDGSDTVNEFGASIPDDTSGVNCAIYDSNAESSGASSTESDSPTVGMTDLSEAQSFCPTQGRSRRLLRIVDRITASNLFQSATEISYIQRAMENMTTKITLRVELKGLVSRVVVNLPPPPSDRIWIAFRGPPRLWISAKPAVGDHSVDWSIVTNVIESKLCDEVYKYLVYPNMVDIIAPFLGQPTYKE